MKEFKDVARDIYSTLLTLITPSMFGIILLRKQIVLLLAGEQYLEASTSLALGQRKVPRLQNDRKLIDDMLRFNTAGHADT